MNFIKKVFEKKVDEGVHLQFQKFSKGEFQNRALIKAKRTGNKFTITTSAEFANEMVKEVARKLGEARTNVTGMIVSTNDLTGKIDFKSKTQFQGVKRYMIDKEMSGEEIISLIEEFPKVFFALSFSVGDTILKIKAKAPKSGKPGKGDEKPKADFCKLVTADTELGKSFIFEKPDFKSAELAHTFFITEITAPKGETDFARIREMAKRKGKIVREGEIDGAPSKMTIELEA